MTHPKRLIQAVRSVFIGNKSPHAVVKRQDHSTKMSSTSVLNVLLIGLNISRKWGIEHQVMMRSLMDTKTPDMMGRLSTARIKYAAAFSTKYIAPTCASDLNILVESIGAISISIQQASPMGIPRTATSRAAIKMLARIASVTSRNRRLQQQVTVQSVNFKLLSAQKYSIIYLPLLVARVSKTLINTSSANGVKMRPTVKTCEAGKDRVCHPSSIRTWASFRSAMRAWKNPPRAFIAKIVLLAEYSMHSYAIIVFGYQANAVQAPVISSPSTIHCTCTYFVCVRFKSTIKYAVSLASSSSDDSDQH